MGWILWPAFWVANEGKLQHGVRVAVAGADQAMGRLACLRLLGHYTLLVMGKVQHPGARVFEERRERDRVVAQAAMMVGRRSDEQLVPLGARTSGGAMVVVRWWWHDGG